MSKDNPYEWDTTASNNADIGGVGIEGSDLPSNFDNALREMMAQQAKRIAAVNGTVASTGSGGAYVVSSGQGYGALADGLEAAFIANHANTGAATLAVDGLTTKAIRLPDGTALIAGDIESGQFCRLAYDAGNEYWLLWSTVAKTGYAPSEAKTAAFSLVAADIGKNFSCDASSGAFTATLPAAATATGRFVAVISNTGATNNVTVDPDGSETINNTSSLILEPGQAALIRCDGTEWSAIAQSATSPITTRGDIIRGDSSGDPERLPLGSAGEVLRSDGSDAAWAKQTVIDTEQATTSGTAFSFTGVPAWARRVTIFFDGVSLTGTDDILVQIGDSGGLETTGYLGASSNSPNGANPIVNNFTNGFGIKGGGNAVVLHGELTLSLMRPAANTWVAKGGLGRSDAASTIITAGSKSLSAALDRLTITRTGSDTFDAGIVNISYEG